MSGPLDSKGLSSTRYDVDQICKKIEYALKLLATDTLHPSLHIHKLKGDLAGSWACTVDFEYRIVFEFVRDPEDGKSESSTNP